MRSQRAGMIHTLLLTRRFPPECCGVGDYAWRLAETLRSRGHRVTILTEPARGPRPKGMDVIEAPLRGWRDLPGVLQAVRREHPSRVQLEYSSYGWSPFGFAFWVNALVLALRLARIRITVACHELNIGIADHPLQIGISLIQRLHFALLVLSANEVLVNMPERLSVLRRWFPWRRARIRYRPNASTIPIAVVGPGRRDAIRLANGAGAGTLVVATFGNFAVAKNCEIVIEAVARVRRSLPIKLWLLGDWRGARPAYLARLRELVRSGALEDDVMWSGYLPALDISAHLQAADVFVLAQADGHLTRSSTFMAAAAHGLPVVAVRNEENQVEFTHGENVWLVENSRAESFVQALEHLAARSALRATLGRNLQLLYASRFDWMVATPSRTGQGPLASAVYEGRETGRI